MKHGGEGGRCTARRLLAAAVLGLAITGFSTTRASAVPAPGITVYDTASATPLVKFLAVHCQYSAVRRGVVLDRDFNLRPSYARSWRLVGQVGGFTTYKTYVIPRTDQGGDDNWFSLRAPDGTIFNNVAKPSGAVIPPFPAQFTFPSGRLTIGLGFVNAWSLSLQRAVTIAGVARCLYPPRRIP